MSGVNKVILVGNLGKDPEVRTLDNGAKVASFSLATSESYKDKQGNKIDQTEWHNIVAWRGLAEIVEKYVKKGMTIYLEGKIRTRSYEKDGNKRYTTEIVADFIQMISKKPEGSTMVISPSANIEISEAEEMPYNEPDKDLPF